MAVIISIFGLLYLAAMGSYIVLKHTRAKIFEVKHESTATTILETEKCTVLVWSDCSDDDTLATIESLANQTLRPKHVVVIDNRNSSDLNKLVQEVTWVNPDVDLKIIQKRQPSNKITASQDALRRYADKDDLIFYISGGTIVEQHALEASEQRALVGDIAVLFPLKKIASGMHSLAQYFAQFRAVSEFKNNFAFNKTALDLLMMENAAFFSRNRSILSDSRTYADISVALTESIVGSISPADALRASKTSWLKKMNYYLKLVEPIFIITSLVVVLSYGSFLLLGAYFALSYLDYIITYLFESNASSWTKVREALFYNPAVVIDGFMVSLLAPLVFAKNRFSSFDFGFMGSEQETP